MKPFRAEEEEEDAKAADSARARWRSSSSLRRISSDW